KKIVTVHGIFTNHIIFLGGHWGQRGLRGHWGHTNLKTMINDSTEDNSLLKERFFSVLSPESSTPDFKQKRPLCPQRPPKK
ncbi:MAG: hypothetical protein LBB88_00265, partial [Planctomycetaceae bacterium]|nr:hypothetical protein [Planctomycetaceae bacterium]